MKIITCPKCEKKMQIEEDIMLFLCPHCREKIDLNAPAVPEDAETIPEETVIIEETEISEEVAGEEEVSEEPAMEEEIPEEAAMEEEVSEETAAEEEVSEEAPEETETTEEAENTIEEPTVPSADNRGKAEKEKKPKDNEKIKKIIITVAVSVAVLSLIALAAVYFLTSEKGEVANTDDEEAVTEIRGEEAEILVPYYDEKTGKYGYCTINGEVVIEPQFDDASPFAENGLAWVMVAEKAGWYGYTTRYGLINEMGEFVLAPQFENVTAFDENGIATAILDDIKYYINSNGKIIRPQ